MKGVYENTERLGHAGESTTNHRWPHDHGGRAHAHLPVTARDRTPDMDTTMLATLSLSYANMNPDDEMIIMREHEPG